MLSFSLNDPRESGRLVDADADKKKTLLDYKQYVDRRRIIYGLRYPNQVLKTTCAKFLMFAVNPLSVHFHCL